MKKFAAAKRILALSLLSTIIVSMVAIIPAFAAITELGYFEFTYGGAVTANEDISGYGNKTDGYNATRGIKVDTAKLLGSVNGSASRDLQWDDYELPKMLASLRGTSSNRWSQGAYIQIKISTKGYQNLEFTSALCGTNKAPRDYILRYSTDGTNFSHVMNGATPVTGRITTNKEVQNIFNNVKLPAGLADKDTLWLRMVVNSNYNISGAPISANSDGGSLGISYISLSGDPLSGKLATPTPNFGDGAYILNDDPIILSSADKATIKYKIDNGETQTYKDGGFALFLNTSATTVNVKAWAEASGFTNSDELNLTYHYKADNLSSFSYKAPARPLTSHYAGTSGIYLNSKLSASADGTHKFVPLYDTERGPALNIAPDDTLTWGRGGYWQYEISTAGYSDIKLSAQACSSRTGPLSSTLKYSVDGVNFYTVGSNTNKPFNRSSFAEYYKDEPLPAEVANMEKVYIRFVFEEDKRCDPAETDPLFNHTSSGNNYINDVVFSGTKMENSLVAPYTLKNSGSFSLNEGIAFTVPSNATAKYNILDKDGNEIITNAEYTAPIVLSSLNGFDPAQQYKYTINIWSVAAGKSSTVSTNTFKYAGETLAAFNVNETTGPSIIGLDTLSATEGTGTLYMKINGKDKAPFDYNRDSIYARTNVDATTGANHYWVFDKGRTKPNEDGHWMIETSTIGYKDIIISADMLSSERGPRDFCISYSTDGTSFTKLYDSVTKMTDALVPAYSGFALPAALNNQEKIYIKIKIDGGENLLFEELDYFENIGKGNTGINNIKISGVALSDYIEINTSDSVIENGKDYVIKYDAVTAGSKIIVAAYNDAEVLTYIKIYQAGEEVVFNTNAASLTSGTVKVIMLDDVAKVRPLTQYVVKSVN